MSTVPDAIWRCNGTILTASDFITLDKGADTHLVYDTVNSSWLELSFCSMGLITQLLTPTPFTIPAGVTRIEATFWGGGGGGGSQNSGFGGGGGGGASVVYRMPFSVSTGDTVTLAPGAAGSGGIQPNDGSGGGNSIFTLNYLAHPGRPIILTAYGGGGGGAGTNATIGAGGGGGGAGGIGGNATTIAGVAGVASDPIDPRLFDPDATGGTGGDSTTVAENGVTICPIITGGGGGAGGFRYFSSYWRS